MPRAETSRARSAATHRPAVAPSLADGQASPSALKAIRQLAEQCIERHGMMPERGNPFDRAMVLCAFIEEGGAAIAVCAHTLLVEAVRDDLEAHGSSDEKRQALLLKLRQFIDSRGGWKFSGGAWTRLPEGGV